MNLLAWSLLGFSVLAFPTIFVCVDVGGAVRARFIEAVDPSDLWSDDFEIMVPIYGSMRYLENVDYLAAYGAKVLICTTTAESDDFYDELDDVAAAHGFRVFRGEVGVQGVAGKRNTGGTVRDRLVRDGLAQVRAANVVCIDADTVTDRPLNELVGAMLANDFDMVSVRLVPSNVGRWITRLQAHEYRVAMSLRKVAPWLISGACHAARTDVHRDVMAHHSLFFQGNDVETGLIAHSLGYRVGHIPFDVPTAVPDSFRAWWRQRLAWSGGEVRLFVVNIHLIRRHPVLWIYGGLIVILATPFRWLTVLSATWVLGLVVVMYVLFALYLHARTRDRWSLVIPLYSAFSSLILTPLGLVSYVRMAITSRNWGHISTRSLRPSVVRVPAAVEPNRLVAVAATWPELERWIAAGATADAAGDWDDAFISWGRALDVVDAMAASDRPTVTDRADLFSCAQLAAERGHRPEAALVLAERAIAALADEADPKTRIRLFERLGHYLVLTGSEPARVVAALAVAIHVGEPLAPTDAYVQALLAAVAVTHERREYRARGQLLERASDAAEDLGSIHLLKRHVLPWVAYVRLLTGDLAGCLAALSRAWSMSLNPDDPMATVVVSALLIDALTRAGRVDDLDEIARTGFDAVNAGGLGDSWNASYLRRNAAVALIDAGRVADAAAIIDPVTEPGQVADMYVVSLRAELDVKRGRDSERPEPRTIGLDLRSPEPDLFLGGELDFQLRYAELALWDGEPGDALDQLLVGIEAAAVSDKAQFLGSALAMAMRACADLADAARAAGSRDALADALGRARALARWVDEWPVAPFGDRKLVARADADYWCWQAERNRAERIADPAPWLRAADEWDRLTRPHHAAYALLRAADALFAQDRMTDAELALARAARRAREHEPLAAAVRMSASAHDLSPLVAAQQRI